jgi:hypothetical protein
MLRSRVSTVSDEVEKMVVRVCGQERFRRRGVDVCREGIIGHGEVTNTGSLG